MKLNKKIWVIIAVGIIVIALAGLGIARFQQIDEQKQLEEQLAQIQTLLKGIQLEQLSSQQAELEEQLNQITSQFEESRDILSQSSGSIAVSSILFDIAEAQGLEVTEVSSPGLTSENFSGTTYSVITLGATTEGEVSNLVEFVTELNNHLVTGVVRSIKIIIPESDDGNKASVNIQLVVYFYRGD